MGIKKDISELSKAGIINSETAEAIRYYYKTKESSSANLLFLVFGILGSILVGLGIILIIAHNWDELSRTTKTFFAFLPLIAAQIISVFVLLKKSSNKTWVESVSTFLIFAVGACLSLVAQIYHIPGNLASFLLVWMLLILPIIYVMNSRMSAILYIGGITYYAMEAGYFSSINSDASLYWGLLLAVLPHYYFLLKNYPRSNFLHIINWLVPLSIVIALGTIASTAGSLLLVSYFCLLSLFYIIGYSAFFENKQLGKNPFKSIGGSGILILLYITSFEGFWQDFYAAPVDFKNIMVTAEFWTCLIISIVAIVLLLKQQKGKALSQLPILSPIFLLFIGIYILGFFTPMAVVLINIIILSVGIMIIIQGEKQAHLGILNFGLSIVTLWIIIRFLNTDLSFVIRGLLLMLLGAGFFAANYIMLKKRKKHGK